MGSVGLVPFQLGFTVDGELEGAEGCHPQRAPSTCTAGDGGLLALLIYISTPGLFTCMWTGYTLIHIDFDNRKGTLEIEQIDTKQAMRFSTPAVATA